MVPSSTSTRMTLSELIVIFFGSLWLFTFGLSQQEVIGFDSRFYLFALEMWRHGATVFPTTYHQPYPDYPVLSTLLIYAAAICGHGLNKCTAVLPTALAASVTLLMTYLIAASRDKVWGIASIFCLLLTVTFVKSARSISLDMSLTMVTTIVFYVLLRVDATSQSRVPVLGYALLLLGFAYRGPIGLIMPTGVGFAYYLVGRQYALAWRLLYCAGLLLVVASFALLVLAYVAGGSAFVKTVLHFQAMGRINNYYLPMYFYFSDSVASYAVAYPLAAVVCVGLYWHRRAIKDSLVMKLIAWVLVILVGMSIPDDKKVHYVLPMAPALALLAAYPLALPRTETYFKVYRTVTLWLLGALPILLSLVFVIGLKHPSGLLRQSHLPAGVIILSLGLLQSVLLVGMVAVSSRQRPIWVLGLAALTFIWLYGTVIEPIAVYLDRANSFVQQAESARSNAHARLVFYKEAPDGLAIKYLIHMPHEEMPSFIAEEKALDTFGERTFFIASEDAYAALSPRHKAELPVVVRGSMSHHPMVIFRNLI